MSTDYRKPNHLIGEKSPYLLQHAYNPVEWYPWSEAAIFRARQTDRPLLVSIGYATCHWCHVMEHESFSNPATAALMNAHFVCVKVDREERPDIDRLYMTAVSAITGSGGWPLNVFLDPHSLKPFFGGTYFPPGPGRGMITWTDLLSRIAAAWKDPEQRRDLVASSEKVTAFLRSALSGAVGRNAAAAPLQRGLFEKALDAFAAMHDRERGGFGAAPKFPMPSILGFLLNYAASGAAPAARREEALTMAVSTLSAMAGGGIYDHLGGGFHRYSTDDRWHLPHFEKMLYDNAQLLVSLADAYILTGRVGLLECAGQTGDYVLNEMVRPEGGFFSAQDADSRISDGSEEKTEGAFYVWEASEIESVLDPGTAKIFMSHYGVRPEGNVSGPPADEFHKKNVLYATGAIGRTAGVFGLEEKDIAARLQTARQALLARRNKRPRPDTDDKIITSWNGLMISGLARLYQISRDTRYRDAAAGAARFIAGHLYDAETGRLYRTWRRGTPKVAGLAEDYAFLAQGLIDLYESDFNPQWLAWAVTLSDAILKLFYDSKNGGLFTTPEDHDAHLLIRMKEDTDNVLPAASSVAARDWTRLSAYTGRADFFEAARATVNSLVPLLDRHPSAVPLLLAAAMEQETEKLRIVIFPGLQAPDAEPLLRIVHAHPAPGRTLFLLDTPERRAALSRLAPDLENFPVAATDRPTVQVCAGTACLAPVSRPDALDGILKERLGFGPP